jgi:hypothetical protein
MGKAAKETKAVKEEIRKICHDRVWGKEEEEDKIPVIQKGYYLLIF